MMQMEKDFSKVMSRKVIGWKALYLRKDSSSEFILTRSKRARIYACIGVFVVFVSLVLVFVLLSIAPIMEKDIIEHKRQRVPLVPLWMRLLLLRLSLGGIILLEVGIIPLSFIFALYFNEGTTRIQWEVDSERRRSC
jgi:hypothetical protein